MRTERPADFHQHGENLVVCEEQEILPLCVSAVGDSSAGADLYGGDGTPLLHDADVHHVQLQHLEDQTQGFLFIHRDDEERKHKRTTTEAKMTCMRALEILSRCAAEFSTTDTSGPSTFK